MRYDRLLVYRSTIAMICEFRLRLEYMSVFVDLKGGSVSTIERLLEVQDHDLRLLRIESELKDIPLRKAAEMERLGAHKAALAEAEAGLQARQAELKRHELEVQSKKEKIAKLRTQQMGLKTNKEFKTMAGEIDTIETSIRQDEDMEIEIMEMIEAAKGNMVGRHQELEAEKSDVQDDVRLLDEREDALKAERDAVQVERSRTAEGIDTDWLQRYESILKSKRGAALVSAEGAVCGGCHMTLPPFQQHAARKRMEMVICGYCGRMLY